MSYAIYTTRNEFKFRSPLSGWYNYVVRDKIPINAYESHICLNREIIGRNGRNFIDSVNYEIARVRSYGMPESPVKDDSILAKNILLAYSYDPELNIPLDKWVEKSVEWLDEEFNPPDHKISYINYEGKNVEIESNNVLSVVLHLDELNPHLHCLVIPFKEDGSLERFDKYDKELNKEKYNRNVELQTSYAEAMSEFGLERGTFNMFTKQISLRKLHSNMNTALNAKLPEPSQNENVEEYRDRVSEIYLNAKKKYYEKMKYYKDMIEQAKEKLRELESTVKQNNILSIILKKLYQKNDISEITRDDIQLIHEKYRETKDFFDGLSKYPDVKEATVACDGVLKLASWYRNEKFKEKHITKQPKNKSISRFEDIYYESR